MSFPTPQTERKIKYENTTLYKNNSDLMAKTKVKYINQITVINRKVSA